MTREEALKLWLPIIDMGVENMPECKEALQMAIKALEQEPTTKNETKYCDRNICLKNEYNNIGCEDCEVTKSQEPILDKIRAEIESLKRFEIRGEKTPLINGDKALDIIDKYKAESVTQ